jgi:hypothetical protein
MKEPLSSRRIKVINFQTGDIHEDAASLNEALVDRDQEESLKLIDSIRIKLNLLKDQILNGDII